MRSPFPGRWPGAECRAHGVLTSGVPPMTQPRSRVDLYAAIRRDARSGMSNRALQRKHGVGFRTVTAALESAWPKERKQPPKRDSRLDAYRVVIDDWLRSDLDAPRKQRHTAKRIFDRLLDEHDGPGLCRTGWSASTSPPDAVRFASRSDGNLPTRSSRKSTSRAARPRLTSATSPSACAANGLLCPAARRRAVVWYEPGAAVG